MLVYPSIGVVWNDASAGNLDKTRTGLSREGERTPKSVLSRVS